MKILVLLGVLVAVGLVVLVVACAARPERTERAPDRRSAGSPLAGNTAPSASPGEAVPTYVTALLSTLALGKVRSVVLVAGRPLPRLTDLSQDPGLVAWTSALPSDFDLHSADVADYAIGYILGLTRSGSSDDATIETVLRAKLVVNGTLADVAFSLKLTTGAGHEHRLEIGFPAPALE